MSEIDDKIREVLKASGDAKSVLEERSIFAEAMLPFKGKRRWVNWLGITYGTIANVIFFWSAYRFSIADESSEKLNWLGIGLVAFLFVAFSKLYFWMEMHTNRTLREVKRVELLVLSRLKTEKPERKEKDDC